MPRARALLADAIEAKGVRVLLGAQTRAIRGDSAVEAVELADGRVLPCGLVVMAVGIRPSTALAATRRPAGRSAASSSTTACRPRLPGIYAIGECAEHRGVCYGLVEPCYEQARVAAAAIAGEPARYAGSVLATNLKVSGVSVFSAGDFEGVGRRDDRRARCRRALLPQARAARRAPGGRRAGRRYGRGAVVRGPDPLRRAASSAFREALAFGQAFAEAA